MNTTKQPILITGANARIGYSLAHALWEAGYQLIATYRDEPGHLDQLVGVDKFQADLATAEGCDALIKHVRENYSRLRGIIHNASLWLDDEPGNLELMQRLHVTTPYQLNLQLAELLKRADKADVIHIGDDSATRGSHNHIGYAATKAALANLALSFAKNFAPAVAVNVVAPGFLLTPADRNEDYKETAMSKALIQAEPGATPLIEAVLFLLQAKYSTGTTVVVNGGRHLK